MHRKGLLSSPVSRLSLAASLLCCLLAKTCQAAYPPGYYNESGCLYSYIEEGEYLIMIPEGEPQKGLLKSIAYDPKTNCTNGNYPGNLFVIFEINDNNMHTMSIDFVLKSSASRGWWEISQAVLNINPVNSDYFPDKRIELRPVDIYAGDKFSFSCSSLVLRNLIYTEKKPSFKITLKRFQVQPFHELDNVIFAPSFDCAVWLTLPMIMGVIVFLLLLFILVFGVTLMVVQGSQSGGEHKFSKSAGILLNQAQLDQIKG